MTDLISQVAEVVEGQTFLMVRCVQGAPVVGLGVSELVGRGEVHRRSFAPAYRIDAAQPASFSWQHSHNGGFLMGEDAQQFVADAKAGTQVRTRIITWDNQTIDSTFSLAGADSAIATALADCS